MVKQKAKKKSVVIGAGSKRILMEIDSVIRECEIKKNLILTTIAGTAGIENGECSPDYSVITEK